LLLHAYDVRKVLYGLGSGLRQNLSFSDFKNLLFPVPPPEEQAAIVRFVAWADDRLARYVQAKRRLIELLEEQKQIIIAQALSRGVRHDAVVAPSGIDWLGHVPTAWEITPLGRLIDLATGFPFKSEGFTEDENDVRLLRGINVAPGRIRWEGVVRWPSADAPTYVGFELKEGDLVLGMDRPVVAAGVRVARVGPSDVPSLLLQRVARIRAHERLDSDFLLLLLSGRAFAHYLAPIFTGVSVPHISPAQIRRFKIALPTVPEQREIVKTVRAETDALDVAASVARREIALLREYRTRLLADVVTGKVDVREAAAHLPDKAGDLEMPTEFDAVNGDQGIADSTQAPALEDAAA
jgi:type I restriction enzyme S subunit